MAHHAQMRHCPFDDCRNQDTGLRLQPAQALIGILRNLNARPGAAKNTRMAADNVMRRHLNDNDISRLPDVSSG